MLLSTEVIKCLIVEDDPFKMEGVHSHLSDLFGNKISSLTDSSLTSIGSNAFAFRRAKTKDGKTYLNVNTHQPLEGPFAWYEAHLVSEEGWNMLGGLFP